MTRRLTTLSAVLAATLLVIGCTIANTTPQNIGLNYTNGPFEGRAFSSCDPPGQRSVDGAFNDHYFYPYNQRTFTFSDAKNADSPPLSVATRDSIQLVSRGTVTFHLNTDCTQYTDAGGRTWPGGRLQKFHETIGERLEASSNDENAINGGPGWGPKVVNTYIKDVVDRALDANGQQYAWPDLYANNEARSAWERTAIGSIPDLVKAQMGDDLMIIDNVLLQKPDVPDSLRAELENNQAAQLRAKTAATDQEAAKNFPGGIQAYLTYQSALAVNEAIKSGRVQVIPIPQGSGVNVQIPQPK